MDDTELGKLTDELNETILDFEAALNEKNFGVPASAQFAGCTDRLAYVKRSQGFRLVIVSAGHHHDDADTETPLCNTARETRLLATELFPVLLKALENSVEKEYRRVVKVTESVEALTKKIRESLDP